MTKRSLTVGSMKNSIQSVQPKIEIQVKQGQFQNQSSVKVIQNQTTYQVIPQKGKTLLQAALEQNQSLDYKCTKGTCGRCTVRLSAGGDILSELNEKERGKLGGLAKEGYRLACQAIFK